MIHLKSKNNKFALLISPDLDGQVKNDEQLYRELAKYPVVDIREIDAVCNVGPVQSLTPTEFEQNWRGDCIMSELTLCPECGGWTQQGEGVRCLDCQEKAQERAKRPFAITFEYCEKTRKWDAYASGASTPLEALQGFNAVLLTMRMATPLVSHNKAILQADGRYLISVGITSHQAN